ncbi:hypothetical protein [Colwellia psychrerythraea]|uniref:Lipoprotein n=1 Tax=Colwellia psychrerythraea TaxID=28229 RepID=A0A099KW64_COLPS|nr:hypothetical protein [Colwellia psychrerythraea]KGJ94821.1 hypothetical protein GAB14E_2055 [Colwellia psychrerythraea]
MIDFSRFSNNKNLPLMPLNLAFVLCFITLISACSSSRPANELSEITVLTQGESIKKRPEMAEACKGFYVSPQKLKEFYQHAALTHEKQGNGNYKELPCYSSGLAYIADDEFHWVLRAGGVAEFYNGEKSFTKICGVSCCNNVQGVC